MNSILLFASVAVGGAMGAVLRYLTEVVTVARLGPQWPWGTFIVNIVGSVILGALTGTVVGADLPQGVSLLLGTGLCGALTTFSSFALQVVDLSRPAGSPLPRLFAPRGWGYAAISMGAGLIAAVSVPALAG